MRFDVMEAKRDGYYSYRWKFDDGKIATGNSFEHVFLRPQMRTVTLEVLKDSKVAAQVKQEINVHVISDKIQLEPGNKPAFENAISESDFNRLPIGDVVNLYVFADGLGRQEWKQKAVAALINRMDEIISRPEHWNFCLDLGQYLRSALVKQYGQALTLFGRLSGKSASNSSIHQDVEVSRAELLIQCFGKYKEVLEILEKLEKGKRLNNKIITRSRIAQAEAMIALGQIEQARGMLQNLHGNKSNKQEVKNVGLLRHARQLADDADDVVQLDYAMENIKRVITDDPIKLLAPNLNLIKLDVHLARKEYRVAFYLAERLSKLEFSNYYKSQILARQVKSLCGVKELEQAKVIYETMTTNYPYSPAVAEAKKAIVETVVAGQK
jgi:outer membrane protein assembly factor BamD (BamD/ComL family)